MKNAKTISSMSHKFSASSSNSVHTLTRLSKKQMLEKYVFTTFLFAISFFGVNPNSSKVVAQNMASAVIEDTLKCEPIMRIHGRVTESKDSFERPIAAASIRILLADEVLAGSYSQYDGSYEIEISKSKLTHLQELTLAVTISGYLPKRKTVFLNDVDSTVLSQLTGDVTLKPIDIQLENGYRIIRTVHMCCRCIDYVPKHPNMLSRDTNIKTLDQNDLQRYNLNR